MTVFHYIFFSILAYIAFVAVLIALRPFIERQNDKFAAKLRKKERDRQEDAEKEGKVHLAAVKNVILLATGALPLFFLLFIPEIKKMLDGLESLIQGCCILMLLSAVFLVFIYVSFEYDQEGFYVKRILRRTVRVSYAEVRRITNTGKMGIKTIVTDKGNFNLRTNYTGAGAFYSQLLRRCPSLSYHETDRATEKKINDGIDVKNVDLSSFLMIGQSNMAGRGEFGEVEEIENKDCFMLRMGRWQPMSEPINPDRAIFKGKFHSGISLGASFADKMQKQTNEKIGLIPCADGGTKLDEWMPGEALFDHAVMTSRLAMRRSNLTAILWHQGESDCKNPSDVDEYYEKFRKMILAMRRALGNLQLPVVIGEISERILPSWEISELAPRLNSVLHRIAEQDPFIAIVSTQDLTLKPDGLHFDSRSLRTLGERYADAALELTR